MADTPATPAPAPAAPAPSVEQPRGDARPMNILMLARPKQRGQGQYDFQPLEGTADGQIRVKVDVLAQIHSSLTGLTADDHLNYVHLSNARVITALHDFLGLLMNAAGGTPSVAGQFRRSNAVLYFHDGTAARRLAQYSNTAPSTNQILVHDGTVFVPVTVGTDASLAADGTLILNSTAITGKPAITAPADDDVILFYDTSTGLLSKMTRLNFGKQFKIAGVTDASSATAGDVGERANTTQTTASVAATGTWGNLAQVSLTAGDWDVHGLISFSLNGATMTACDGVLSVNSGNTTTDHAYGDNWVQGQPPTGTCDATFAIPAWRVSISATTTYYLKGKSTHSAGTPQFRGRISARRVR